MVVVSQVATGRRHLKSPNMPHKCVERIWGSQEDAACAFKGPSQSGLTVGRHSLSDAAALPVGLIVQRSAVVAMAISKDYELAGHKGNGSAWKHC